MSNTPNEDDVYDGEPDDIDRAKNGVQDDMEDSDDSA